MSQSSEQDRGRIISETLSWLGTPYHHQARQKGSGTDCLGLLLGVWEAIYGKVPEEPWAYDPRWIHRDPEDVLLKLAKKYTTPLRRSDRQAGDFIIVRLRSEFAAKHVGILVETDTIVHADNELGVIKVPLKSFKKIGGFFRFPSIRSYRNSLDNK